MSVKRSDKGINDSIAYTHKVAYSVSTWPTNSASFQARKWRSSSNTMRYAAFLACLALETCTSASPAARARS